MIRYMNYKKQKICVSNIWRESLILISKDTYTARGRKDGTYVTVLGNILKVKYNNCAEKQTDII